MIRPSYNGKALLSNEDEEFAGIDLGYDFTAEHEWGIDDLRHIMGMPNPNKPMGIKRHTMCCWQDGTFTCGKSDDYVWLMVGSTYDVKRWSHQIHSKPNGLYDFCDRYLPGFTSSHSCDDFYAAWDQGAFFIVSDEPYVMTCINLLIDAFEKKNVAVFLGKGFMGSGLCIALTEHMSKDVKRKILDDEKEHYALKRAFERSGIQKKIEAANLSFFALSPRSLQDDGDKETQYDFVVWLNPREQQKYNGGLYTVEELIEWTEGKGCVIKDG